MISELTAEQTALLPVYRDKWLQIGLSTEPTDRPAAEAAVKAAYVAAGLTPPTTFYWESSPYHGAKRAALLADPDKLLQEPTAHATTALAQLSHACYGSQDAAWLAFYNYFLEVTHIEACERLIPLMDAARHLGWWWPFQSAVVMTPKPSALNIDEAQRLHCETGPAVDYDGTWSVWAWHGTRVPQFVIEDPDSITAEAIINERNAEVARVMLTRMGADRFAREANPTVVHHDDSRRLLRITLPHDPEGVVQLVHVTDPSTGFEYMLRVPPAMKTCHEAVAWTFGFVGKDADNYQPLVEA